MNSRGLCKETELAAGSIGELVCLILSVFSMANVHTQERKSYRATDVSAIAIFTAYVGAAGRMPG